MGLSKLLWSVGFDRQEAEASEGPKILSWPLFRSSSVREARIFRTSLLICRGVNAYSCGETVGGERAVHCMPSLLSGPGFGFDAVSEFRCGSGVDGHILSA